MITSGSPPRRSVVVRAGTGRQDVAMFGNLGVHAEVEMALYMRDPDDDSVSILFGRERFRLEFLDLESLERMRELTDEGVRRLRAAAAPTAQAESAS